LQTLIIPNMGDFVVVKDFCLCTEVLKFLIVLLALHFYKYLN